ncbi:hypothetical protein GCM10023321_46180 [Pseudonocardia eucalypti]|uniref:Membrane transport protein MMPL domain-containing protein n=1 Tax=Pseudonocardia eucalypti TaxID=648755 RepID=A0ABP9QGN3_9PSEU|nr:putative RND superfamily exporter protein [Pseudonocardia eucalypti]
MTSALPPRRLAVLLLAVLVCTGTVIGLARLRTDTAPTAFLPAGDPALTALEETARAFGGDPVVVLAESARPRELMTGAELGRLLSLEGRLAELPDVAVVYGPGTALNQIVASTRNLVAAISGRRDAIRATGDPALAEFDLRYGPLVVQAMPAGVPSVRNQGFVDSVVFGPDGATRASWRYLVPAPNAVAILVRPREGLDEAGTRRLVAATRDLVARAGLTTTRTTVTGTPTVFADLGQRVQREIPLLGAVALALIIACYLGIGWTGRRRDRLLPLAATLGSMAVTLAVFGWLGIELSLGAVAFLPILIGIGSDFPAYLVHGAPVRRVLVAAGASAAGFASLALSPLPFVRDLGLALGLGVLLAVAIAFLIRPKRASPAEPAPVPVVRRGLPRRTRVAVAAALAAVAALGWVMLPRLEVRAQPDELAAGLPSVADARHAEDVIGSSGAVQVLLRGENVRDVAALDWMRRAEEGIVRQYGGALRPAVSLPDLLAFLGPNPTPEQFQAGVGLLPHYLVSAVLSDDGRSAVLSLGISLQDLREQRDLLGGLRAALPPPPPGMTSEVVGLPSAAARGYELVSEHRYLANLVGIAAAGLVLFLGLARRSDAVRAVSAAVLATGWGLAGAWLLGIPLSPLSVALGSLTTATACEFSVLLGYRGSGRNPRNSRNTRRTVAVAALAAALGYLSLTLSELAILRHFGLLLAASVGLSLLAAIAIVRLFPPGALALPGVAAEPDRKVAV